jgi:Uma2 family endonuclease
MATATANATVEVPPSSGSEPGDLFRISLEIYRTMGEVGLLVPTDRVELLDGLLVKKMTKGPSHTTVTLQLFMRLIASLPAGWFARKEDPIELPAGPAGDSAPEPDIAVVVGAIADYRTRHPGPAEVALVVQVAADSQAVRRDRQGLARYAWAGIPTVWIVNLTNDTVEVSTQPSGPVADPRYGLSEVKKVGEIAEVVIAGVVVGIPVDDIVR